jgi:transcription elongation factor GreA
MHKVPMTIKGAEALKHELEQLKKKRPQIAKTIAEARALGDLKENAEYHAAKELQGLTEAKIRNIEGKLSHAQVIDVSKLPMEKKVVFGVTVTLNDLEQDKKITYQIVGEDEADHKKGKISFHSPLARALIGKTIGDYVDVTMPAQTITYEIISIEYI